MNPKRSSRTPKTSKKTLQRSPSPNDLIKRKSMSRWGRSTGLSKRKASDCFFDADQEQSRDILDIIDSAHTVENVIEEDDGESREVVDKGLDESDDDCVSVCSIVSGPSPPSNLTLETENLCSTCQKLYKKAKRMKAPPKNKLLDNDPKSHTCDHWVLTKRWSRKAQPDTSGMLLMHVTLIKRRLRFKKTSIDQHLKAEESTACSRPHIFLQRNFRKLVKMPTERGMKKNGRKRRRRRDDSQGSRAAKQQRLNHQHSITTKISRSKRSSLRSSSSSALEGSSDQETNRVTFNLIPCSVRLERINGTTLKQNRRETKAKVAANGGFRDLLAQLRGHSSMIVRETR